jgi:hypothetical protein
MALFDMLSSFWTLLNGYFFPGRAAASSIEPMISASMGGGLPGNHAAATEPVATLTFSP